MAKAELKLVFTAHYCHWMVNFEKAPVPTAVSIVWRNSAFDVLAINRPTGNAMPATGKLWPSHPALPVVYRSNIFRRFILANHKYHKITYSYFLPQASTSYVRPNWKILPWRTYSCKEFRADGRAVYLVANYELQLLNKFKYHGCNSLMCNWRYQKNSPRITPHRGDFRNVLPEPNVTFTCLVVRYEKIRLVNFQPVAFYREVFCYVISSLSDRSL